MTATAGWPVFAPLGDRAVLITLSDVLSPEVNRRVHACVSAIRAAELAEVVDVVPAHSSFAVHYDAIAADAGEITIKLREIVRGSIASDPGTEESRLVRIPVRYDGPDLGTVAQATTLTVEEVIARHTAPEYLVYMIGFAPGFAYLGDLDPALHLPRRETPRTRVPRGSVGIAGFQTAVYPFEISGGWHLIGTTTLDFFHVERAPPSLLKAGDRVCFERIP